jgi:hypothetical protein
LSGRATEALFTTVGGALVTVVATGGGAYQYSCGGCGARDEPAGDPAAAQAAANLHAWRCRGVSYRQGQDPELLRELALDLRYELHQLDTRAAAGMAICAAVLIGVVGQAPRIQPVYTFSVAGAALLTVAVLLFLAALLAAPSGSSGTLRRRKNLLVSDDGQAERSIASCDDYLALRLVDLRVAVRTKRQRFTSAAVATGLALVTVSCGAVAALLLGL